MSQKGIEQIEIPFMSGAAVDRRCPYFRQGRLPIFRYCTRKVIAKALEKYEPNAMLAGCCCKIQGELKFKIFKCRVKEENA
jgi:hypothetical protein